MLENERPLRRVLFDHQGRKVTLSSGSEAFVRLDTEQHPDVHVILGVGSLLHKDGMAQALPHPSLMDVFHDGFDGEMCATNIYWLDNIHFITSMLAQNPLWLKEMPAHWTKLGENDAVAFLQEQKQEGKRVAVWWFKQNIRLFPSFWAPLWGQMEGWFLRAARDLQSRTCYQGQKPIVYLTGNSRQLLHSELSSAFSAQGFDVICAEQGKSLRDVLSDTPPSLVCAVNLHGLDVEGTDFALLQALGIPVAAWFVDNPWHVLSGIRLPWWQDVHIFVTDASFVRDLQKKGATKVHHLPLAASDHMLQYSGEVSPSVGVSAAQNAACTFVGSASFPDKANFFAAARVRPELMQRAMDMLEEGQRPHFNWWAYHTGVQLWPGYGIRCVGLGAEECSLRQRTEWLQALLPLGLALFGDRAAWGLLLPDADSAVFQSPVDYYTELPAIYNAANTVLNVTSLLLPEGLTQRHFDVWAAGGFLLTDNTGGLDIFPQELTRHTSLAHHSHLPHALKRFSDNQRQELVQAWQELVREHHTYAHRIATILDACGC